MFSMIKSLHVLHKLLEKATLHIQENGLTEAEILNARLAPDMLPFTNQIQMATDTAKFTMARLSGELDSAPKFEDTETSFEELKTRIQHTIDYIEGFDFERLGDYQTRPITVPAAKGFVIDGENYLYEFALPNFYFHLTTTYAILRHLGIAIGKRDYLGRMSLKALA